MQSNVNETTTTVSIDEPHVESNTPGLPCIPQEAPPKESTTGMATEKKYKTDKYSGLLPPLSPDEYESLKAKIQIEGQRDPIHVDENGNVLDGSHRLKICRELTIEPRVMVVSDMSESQKAEFAFSKNLDRRQLDKAKLMDIRDKRLANLLELRAANPKQYTYEVIGTLIGQHESWVRKREADGNRKNPNASKQDARHNHDQALVTQAVKRVSDGEDLKAVAEELHVPKKVIQSAAKKAVKVANAAKSPPPSPAEAQSPELEIAEVPVAEYAAAKDDDSVPPLVRQVLQQQGVTEPLKQREWYDDIQRKLRETRSEWVDRLQAGCVGETPLMNLLMAWVTLADTIRDIEERIGTLLHAPVSEENPT